MYPLHFLKKNHGRAVLPNYAEAGGGFVGFPLLHQPTSWLGPPSQLACSSRLVGCLSRLR